MPGKWWVLAAGGAGEVVGAAAGHGAVGKVHLSGRPQKKWAKITPLSPISSSPHIPQSGQGGRPASRFCGVGRPVLGGRLAGSAGRPAAHHLRLNHHLAGTGSYVAALVRLGKTRSARSNCRRQQLERTQRDGRGLDQKASTTDSPKPKEAARNQPPIPPYTTQYNTI